MRSRRGRVAGALGSARALGLNQLSAGAAGEQARSGASGDEGLGRAALATEVAGAAACRADSADDTGCLGGVSGGGLAQVGRGRTAQAG